MLCYTGSYTRMGGPGVAAVEETNGKLTLLARDQSLADPIYVLLSKDCRTLFVTGADPETNEGAAATYAVDGGSMKLTSTVATLGAAACHATLSADERFMYVANYVTGCICVLPVKDDKLCESIQHIVHEGSGPSLPRQASAHTHQCLFRPETNELFVCDLGMDLVFVYEQDPATGLLTEKMTISTEPGMGPRHIVFADKDHFYLAGELDNYAAYYVWQNEQWNCVQRVPVLPADFNEKNTAAAIRLHEGRLYVSNRGHDSVCVIELAKDGMMGAVRHIPSNGKAPRDFEFTPEGKLMFANQDGGGLVVEDGDSLDMPGVVCIALAK